MGALRHSAKAVRMLLSCTLALCLVAMALGCVPPALASGVAVGAGKQQQPDACALLPTQDDTITGFSASTALAVNDLATVVTGTDPLHGVLNAVTGSEEIASGIRMGLDVLTMLTPGSGAANAASHADDVLRVAASAASHADDVARVAGSVATHADDVAHLVSSAAGRADDVARVAAGVTGHADDAARAATGAVDDAAEAAANAARMADKTGGVAQARGVAGAGRAGEMAQNAPYAHLQDPPGVGAGRDFTAVQKDNIIAENMSRNGGVVRSDLSGEALVKPQQSQRGVTPPQNEWQIDHVEPKPQGGTNSYSNA